MRIIFIILLFSSLSSFGQRTILGIYKNGTPGVTQPVLIVMAGESNSTGYADNGLATAPELAVRNLLLLGNSNYIFSGLHIGVNNIINAAGGVANCPSCTTQGMELGIANEYDDNFFEGHPVYIVKAGQGGSTIGEWDNTDAYYDSLINRTTRAISLIEDATGIVPKIFFYWSQGINNIILGTTPTAWKSATITFFNNFRTEVNTIVGETIIVPILFTKFNSMPTNLAYETVMDEIADELSDCYAVSTLGADLKDDNHWQYAGFKDVIVPNFLTITITYL